MNRPSWPTYLLGNAPVAAALALGGLVLLYRWGTGVDDLGAAIVGGAMVGAASKAYSQLSSYRRWQQSWGAMGGDVPKRPSKILPRMAGVLLIAALAAYFYEHRDEPYSRFALIWLTVGLAAFIAVAVIRRLRKVWVATASRRRANDEVVSISIGSPLLDVPPLSVAYQRLPAHCLPLLSGRKAPAKQDSRTAS